MPLLSACCFCLPLRAGCYIIAGLYIINSIYELYTSKVNFDHLGPEDNEDEENKEQKARVMKAYIFRSLIAVIMITGAFVVIYGTFKRTPTILRLSAYALAVLSALQFVVYGLVFEGSRLPWISELINLLLQLYCAAVLYSYSEYLVDKIQNSGYITIYEDRSGQQVMYPGNYRSARIVRAPSTSQGPTVYPTYIGGRYIPQTPSNYSMATRYPDNVPNRS